MDKFFSLAVVLCLLCQSALSDVGAFYRYKDDNGNIVIDRIIPADRVSGGYEVLSDTGRVIEVVDRQLTEAEISAFSDRQRQERLSKESKERQKEYDLQLLRRYSFVADIESERDRKVREMDVRVQILRGNLLGVRNEIEVEYGRAAKIEKRGSKIPEGTQKRIEELEQKLTATEQLMKKLLLDMEATRKEYLLSIERFKMLKSLR